MSTDSMPILPETDPASDRWAIQDSNGGKCLQDMNSEVVFESIRISKCLLNESTDSRCGDKPALKMKIVLAEKKDKSEISQNPNRIHEDDEDTDIVEDESDSSAELTIVDDVKQDKPPPEEEPVKRKSPKEGRKKRKAKEVAEPKSHAMKKRREEREAEKRRAEEIFKNQENEAMAKRIAMEFSNFRRFRAPPSGESAPKTDNNLTVDSRTSRTEASPRPSAPESSSHTDSTPVKSSLDKAGNLSKALEVSVVIPSNENLRTMARNGTTMNLAAQYNSSCFEKPKGTPERKDTFPPSSAPPLGKHHIPIGLPPAPSSTLSTLSVPHQSAGSTKRESPRPNPRCSPDGSLILPEQMNQRKKITIDLANSPEPPQTIVCTPSYCPRSPPPTIHIPGPLCHMEQSPQKHRESASEPKPVQNRHSPQVHVSSQSDVSIATRTSPPSLYTTPPSLSVEVPLSSSFTAASTRNQPPVSLHSRARPVPQNQFRSTAANTETERRQSSERPLKPKPPAPSDADRTNGQVFNPKFSAFSVDSLTKVDPRAREKKSLSSNAEPIKEPQRNNQATFELKLPPGSPQEKQAASRTPEDSHVPSEKVRVVRQSEFEFARPQAAPRKSRSKPSSPPPLSSSAPSCCTTTNSGNINGPNTESKSALIWRYIQDQSGGNTMQTIDSALESVRASSNNCHKQDDCNTILANYLQGQRKEDPPDEITRERALPERPTSPDSMSLSRDPRSLYLTKLKKMLVTLQKFSTTISMDVGKAVYHNIYALASGGANVEEFIAKTQRATKLALKPYVGPFLASYLPLLQKEITVKAANVRMSSSRYMRSNPECLIDPSVEPGDPHEVFVSEFDIPNKKKTPPQPPPGPNLMVAQGPVQNMTLDPIGSASVSVEMHDIDSRYQTHLTIQNDLMLIQEMLDRISKMVESTKRALSTLQEDPVPCVSRDTSAHSSPCCSPIVAHSSSPSSALSPKDLATSLARLENLPGSPPRYSSHAQTYSACNTQQKSPNYPQSGMWTPRSTTNELPRNAAANCFNQTQKDSMMRHEMRNSQVPHAMPTPAPPPYAMRPSNVPSPTAVPKETATNSNPNPSMPISSMGYGSPDLVASRNDSIQKEYTPSSSRESMPLLSSSTTPTFLSSAAAEKKYQESLRLKSLSQSSSPSSSSTNVIPKSPINLSSPQRLISQPTNIGDPECCWNCGRSAQETCSGCKLAKYCGLFCQHRDWEIHHRVCRVIGSNSPKSPSPN